jgi:hypothetical protein
VVRRVVKNAPSKWIDTSCFHLTNSNWSSGPTVWMPALLIKMSMPQKQRRLLPYGVRPRVVGNVHADADRTVHISEFGRRGSGTRLSEISDDNFGAFATVGARNLSADAARRADRAFEMHGKILLSPQLSLGDIAEAGGVLADVWERPVS